MEPNQPRPAQEPGHDLRRLRLYSVTSFALLLGGALIYIGLVDPHNTRSVYPMCPFKFLTGWDCPACGGLRMVHDLLHGDLVACVHDNVFLLVAIPLGAVWFLVRRYSGKSSLWLPVAITVVVAAGAWMVVRNLPGFPLVPTVLGG